MADVDGASASADEALESARNMRPGPERNDALKKAGMLRNAADVDGLIFARRGRPRADAQGNAMRSKEKIVYLTADHLEQQAASRTREAEQLPPGEARQHVLKNAAQLRTYAAMKRLLAPESPGVGISDHEVSDVGS